MKKQMFLDSTTFFNDRRNISNSLPLHMAAEHESLHWQTLVDRSLVYHVEEDESIKVHDQLLSLGQKIAYDCSRNNKCRIWDWTMALMLLHNNGELDNQDIHALWLSHECNKQSF
ncbi:unnamed protein product [Calypogeia fissa]